MQTKMTINPINTENDMLLQGAIAQGYVLKGCCLAGVVVIALVHEGQNPCEGCNADRRECHQDMVKPDGTLSPGGGW